MSVAVMGAVLQNGPKQGSLRHALVAIADNADDFGFAYVSMETIAAKSCCDRRTAMRRVQALERDGWMRVERDVGAIDGRCNVYFVNVARLGVTQHAKMRRSDMHARVEAWLKSNGRSRETGDKMSPIARAALRADQGSKEGAKRADSGDKMSPVATAVSRDIQVPTQVTKNTDSGDKMRVAISKNRCEPLRNRSTPPLPPVPGGGWAAEDGTALVAGERVRIDGAVMVLGERVRMDAGAVMGPEFLEVSLREQEEFLRARGVTEAAKLAGRLTHDTHRVMRAMGWVANPDRPTALERAIYDALELHCGKEKTTPAEAADLAIANAQAFVRERPAMRHGWSWQRFFREGHWRDARTWPYDTKALEQTRQDAKARIGLARRE